MGARAKSTLVVANVALVGAMLLHGYDHFRQERGVGALTTEVLLGGVVLFALALGALVVNVRRSPRAPLISMAVGLYIAIAVSASHMAPHWSAFSDPYADLGVDALSWFAALLEIGVALVFGLLGARALTLTRHVTARAGR
jgi:hypothetical protein